MGSLNVRMCDSFFTQAIPSLRETFELTEWFGPPMMEPRFNHAFERQLKFDTRANPKLQAIPDVKDLFNAGGTVTKVCHW